MRRLTAGQYSKMNTNSKITTRAISLSLQIWLKRKNVDVFALPLPAHAIFLGLFPTVNEP